MRIFVTGGAGFIGSALIRYILSCEQKDLKVVNIDKLTYAGNLESLAMIDGNPRYQFAQVDICDAQAVDQLFAQYKPDGVIHLAAESHVDRSIDGPSEFMQTNIIGTYTLLEAARKYYIGLDEESKLGFKFHHVSTDEVYGSLGAEGMFTEETTYDPRSPYSASKASSDHLVRAWYHTFKLPCVITNCSNNYGPYHFPEKLIPLVTLNALEGRKLPVYGDGSNIRDWLYVEDHARALLKVFLEAKAGATYNIGGHNEKTNLYVVELICDILDELSPNTEIGMRRKLIEFVKDRPGHDQRYAIDASLIKKELGWVPAESFETGIRKTIQWYLDNKDGWCKRVQDGNYQRERLGSV